MEQIEYLAFLPLLLYGIALAGLLAEWKRFFVPSQMYLPYILLTIMMTETGIYNVFIYKSILPELATNYLKYLLFLAPPFLFLLTVNVFTPDEKLNTKEYFLNRLPVFSALFAAFFVSNFLFSFQEEFLAANFMYIMVIIILIIMAITRKAWVTYILIALWFSTFLMER